MNKGLCTSCPNAGKCEKLKFLDGIPNLYITRCEDYNNGEGRQILSREQEKEKMELEYIKQVYGHGGPGGF